MLRKLRRAVPALLLLLATAAVAAAHDLFVRPERFFVPENAELLVRLLNGTFSVSENSIARERLLDVSVVSPAGRERIDTARWSAAGDTSTFRTGAAGTYALGVSTRPNVISLTAAEFNQYLRDDGVPDVLAARERDQELGRPVRERYHKHVKALLQVGERRSDDYATGLGYPAELVPLENPYLLRAGGVLRVRALVDGKPVREQFLLYGGRNATGGRIEPRSVRSDEDGAARIPLGQAGTWYVKFIHMTRIAGDTAADYESRWASLTFAVR